MLNKRKEHYESINCALDGFDRDIEDDNDEESLATNDYHPLAQENVDAEAEELADWRKFLLVIGRAGTGKSFALVKVIDACVSISANVFVATPTGFLATQFKDKFPEDIDADTMPHSNTRCWPKNDHVSTGICLITMLLLSTNFLWCQ